MIKIFKMVMICTLGSVIMSSCIGDKEPYIYTEIYSVIQSNMGAMYFSSDDGIDLYPANGVFNTDWGSVGDRVVVGFNYNPYKVSETTTRMDITVEILIAIQTSNWALPSTVDTVGSGTFLYDNGNTEGIYAWTSQNYLTAIFSLRYGDAMQHTFGFIEAPELFRNDTLFLSLWHNTKDKNKSQTAKSHIALNLSNYDYYLSVRDSTVISIKYNAESSYTENVNNYTYNVIYRRTDNNTSGY
jgi:hypothetical protein